MAWPPSRVASSAQSKSIHSSRETGLRDRELTNIIPGSIGGTLAITTSFFGAGPR